MENKNVNEIDVLEGTESVEFSQELFKENMDTFNDCEKITDGKGE